MAFVDFGERVLRNSWRLPGVGRLVELDYERAFAKCPPNRFRGVYRTFDEARATIPSGTLVGYDHALAAGQYRDRMDKACQSDYGVLFWLRPVLDATSVVFDLGGHVGVSYHGWRKYLDYQEGMRWCVYDMPAIARVGEEIARERPSRGLSFTNDLGDARGCNILLTAGAIQYVEEDLASLMVRNCGPDLPRHLFVNKVPVYDGESFVTVQSTGRAFNPYRVFNREELIGSITRLGYRLVDDWVNREQYCYIPFVKGKDIEAYSGYYFTRA